MSELALVTICRVGPRDYMPPWPPIDARQGSVSPNFDVYMLGKLLWCMIAGRLKLFREYHTRAENNLEVLFPNDPNMTLVNRVLSRCITEEQDQCLDDASKLLPIVEETLSLIEKGAQPLDARRQCLVCGKGSYLPHGSTLSVVKTDKLGRTSGNTLLSAFLCNVCKHFEFFAPGYPTQAAKE
jgi:hypothetical protein